MLVLLALALPTLFAVIAMFGFIQVARTKKIELPVGRRPITLLKPLAGADDALESNLATFFVQDHPQVQILFGVEGASDPAVAIARRVMAAHPHVDAKLVIHGRVRAVNPKVSNLLGLWPHIKHERVLISDSNVAAPRDLLRDLDDAMDERTGLVSSLFAGTGESTLGAALECAQLSGFVAAGVVVPAIGRDPVVVGKSMMVRKSALERLGGLESVADVLAEDYLIGKMLQHGGWDVKLGTRVVDNVCQKTTVEAFMKRQLRWSMMRMRLHPLAFLLEPMTSPLVAMAAAWTLIGPWAFAVFLALVAMRDVAGWVALRGPRRLYLPLVLAPLREVLALAIWAFTPFVKNVSWRGHTIRLGTGTRVFVGDPALAPATL